MTITVIGDNTGDDYAGTEDAGMRSGNNSNFGAASSNYIGLNTSTYTRNLILRFTGLSNIAASDSVSAATVYLWSTVSGGANATQNGTFEFVKCLRNWVELEVARQIYATGLYWTTNLGMGVGTDRSATSSGYINNFPPSGGAYYSGSSSQLAADVEDFISGALTNNGWLIDNIDYDGDGHYLVEMSEGTDGQRPYLSVTHAAGGGFQAAWCLAGRRSNMIGAR